MLIVKCERNVKVTLFANILLVWGQAHVTLSPSGISMLSRTQAEAYGHKQRDVVGRSALAELKPRNFDPVQVLREASKGRVARLLPVKFKLMSASPFAFYRGSVEVMAADLALAAHTGIEVQLCGDAHVKNFGFYATPGSDIVLDINDFDQTTRGPWEWDVKRMTASIVLAGRDAGDSVAKCRNAAGAFVDEYCAWMGRFARMPTMDVARHRTTRDPDDPVMRSALEKAERVTPLDSLHKLTHKTKSGRRFRFQPNVLWQVPKKISSMVIASLRQYRETLSPDRQMLFDRYRAAEVGFKVAGTGNVGTRDFVGLLFGRGLDESLFL